MVDRAESIDVLLPTIRIDDWLDQSVASVLTQSASCFHLYVILDGTPPEPYRGWMDDSRVTLLHIPKRGGLARGLNYALASSQAPLVARVDADDPSMPERLQQQRDFLVRHPDVAVVSSAATVIDRDDNVLGRVGPTDVVLDAAPTLILRNRILHSAVMFRREAIERAGGYDESMPFMEDYELWLRVAKQDRICIVPDQLIRYRKHVGQMTKVAPPWGPYVQRISRRRRELAAATGRSTLATQVKIAAWSTRQLLRYARWRLASDTYD